MKKRNVIIGLVIVLAVFMAFGCSGSGSNNTDKYQQGDSTQVNKVDNKQPLEILESHLVKEEYGGYSVEGTAMSNKDLSYAEITVKCYDADGATIGSYLTNMQNLKAGEKWSFKVIGPIGDDKRVANYTIANGNSF